MADVWQCRVCAAWLTRAEAAAGDTCEDHTVTVPKQWRAADLVREVEHLAPVVDPDTLAVRLRFADRRSLARRLHTLGRHDLANPLEWPKVAA